MQEVFVSVTHVSPLKQGSLIAHRWEADDIHGKYWLSVREMAWWPHGLGCFILLYEG